MAITLYVAGTAFLLLAVIGLRWTIPANLTVAAGFGFAGLLLLAVGQLLKRKEGQ